MKDITTYRVVCSACQTPHPVERIAGGRMVMVQHECFGIHCTGSNCYPETTFPILPKVLPKDPVRFMLNWRDNEGNWDDVFVETLDDAKLVRHVIQVMSKSLCTVSIIDQHTGEYY